MLGFNQECHFWNARPPGRMGDIFRPRKYKTVWPMIIFFFTNISYHEITIILLCACLKKIKVKKYNKCYNFMS